MSEITFSKGQALALWNITAAAPADALTEILTQDSYGHLIVGFMSDGERGLLRYRLPRDGGSEKLPDAVLEAADARAAAAENERAKDQL